ncbi:hypothetical protein [Dorea sp. AF36-15AT]|uniref:hypothetical protein n=1 Tax=Dorea sp. AF36-15AT TaxID=2292041 RepID=UPI000E54C3BD|nr:hypothetical protein [Dorea sp. AF36-15AT]RHP10694.1 hypothetical protein DWZ93_01420 [Dorea sp. AF36-15AT]
MKKLKRTKGLLAFLLALCICAILPSATVLAEDENDSVDVMDSPGGGTITVETTVRNNFTDFNVTDDINLTIGEDYIIDFTKEDILSYALRSMVDLEKTKYYQFANSDKNSLIETENISDAFLKIVGNKAENKAVMTLMDEANAGASYPLQFMRTEYTGAILTYLGTDYDEQTGNAVIKEIRDDYYTRYHFNCKLNLNTSDIESGIIKNIRIDNATLSFKTNETPTFTAKVSDGYGDFYTLSGQDWSVGPWANSDQIIHATERSDEYVFKAFEKGKKYNYSVFIDLTSAAAEKNCKFDENTKLILNGKEVTYSSMEVAADHAYFYDIAEMTPVSEVTPQPEQDTPLPGKSDDKDAKNKDQKSILVIKDQKINPAVKTGDYADPLLWVIILLLAVTGAGTAVFYKRKN